MDSETENITKTKSSIGRRKIALKIFRTNTAKSNKTYFDSYVIPIQPWTTVLDGLLYAKSYADSSIGIRYSCRMASCGSCGMKINGVPRLACYTKISDLEGFEVVCEPLPNFPIIRDLVTDFGQFFSHHKSVNPYLIKKHIDRGESAELSQSHCQSPEEVEKYLQFSYCIKCGLCYSACPTVATDVKFPGPQALSQLYRYYADSRDTGRDRLATVDNRHGIWRCHFAGSCSRVCPKGVDPALGIQLLRSYMLGISKNQPK